MAKESITGPMSTFGDKDETGTYPVISLYEEEAHEEIGAEPRPQSNFQIVNKQSGQVIGVRRTGDR